MYIGAFMPPRPIRPMKSPWPIQSGQGGPNVESVRPRPIISAPNMTVHRVPTLSAMRPIRMPPKPEPSQARALANAGIERTPSTSAAMSLSATAVIHAAPNAISIVTRATVAPAQHALVSIEEGGDCSIMKFRRPPFWQAAQNLTTHIDVGLLCLLHLRQTAREGPPRKFPSRSRANYEIDRKSLRYNLYLRSNALRRAGQAYMSGTGAPVCRDKAIHAASTGQPRG